MFEPDARTRPPTSAEKGIANPIGRFVGRVYVRILAPEAADASENAHREILAQSKIRTP